MEYAILASSDPSAALVVPNAPLAVHFHIHHIIFKSGIYSATTNPSLFIHAIRALASICNGSVALKTYFWLLHVFVISIVFSAHFSLSLEVLTILIVFAEEGNNVVRFQVIETLVTILICI